MRVVLGEGRGDLEGVGYLVPETRKTVANRIFPGAVHLSSASRAVAIGFGRRERGRNQDKTLPKR